MLTQNNSLSNARTVHPLWLRLVHVTNAIAALILIASGWRIYNASPFLGFTIPADFTLGGWLAGAIQWHFAAMWVLFLNGLVYLAIGLIGGRLRQRLWPLSLRRLWQDIANVVRGQLSHNDLHHYNQVQKFAYLFAIADLVVLVLSGLVLWKSVQFPILRELLGGYELARRVHFMAMAGLVGFIVVHVTMALLVPRTLLAMIRGR